MKNKRFLSLILGVLALCLNASSQAQTYTNGRRDVYSKIANMYKNYLNMQITENIYDKNGKQIKVKGKVKRNKPYTWAMYIDKHPINIYVQATGIDENSSKQLRDLKNQTIKNITGEMETALNNKISIIDSTRAQSLYAKIEYKKQTNQITVRGGIYYKKKDAFKQLKLYLWPFDQSFPIDIENQIFVHTVDNLRELQESYKHYDNNMYYTSPICGSKDEADEKLIKTISNDWAIIPKDLLTKKEWLYIYEAATSYDGTNTNSVFKTISKEDVFDAIFQVLVRQKIQMITNLPDNPQEMRNKLIKDYLKTKKEIDKNDSIITKMDEKYYQIYGQPNRYKNKRNTELNDLKKTYSQFFVKNCKKFPEYFDLFAVSDAIYNFNVKHPTNKIQDDTVIIYKDNFFKKIFSNTKRYSGFFSELDKEGILQNSIKFKVKGENYVKNKRKASQPLIKITKNSKKSHIQLTIEKNGIQDKYEYNVENCEIATEIVATEKNENNIIPQAPDASIVSEVTNGQYLEFLNAVKEKITLDSIRKLIVYDTNLSVIRYNNESNKFYLTDTSYKDYPVVLVTYYGAEAYASYNNCELLDVATWEYYASGGETFDKKTKEFTSPSLWLTSWFYANSDGHLHKVKTKEANESGLYDMCGNVMEWTKKTEEGCIVKGGSYRSDMDALNIWERGMILPPDYADVDLGFRVKEIADKNPKKQ